MNIRIEVESDINTGALLDKARDPAFWKFAAVTWHKLYEPYVPYKEGHLYNTIHPFGEGGAGVIEHTVDYAHYIYEGNFNFSQDQHQRACRHWDEAAEPTQKPKLIQAMQDYIDKGGLSLGGS